MESTPRRQIWATTPTKPPIVFKSPGLKPDTCFKVFDQEFHVTSLTLQIHSEFFRTFFEPSGGKAPTSMNPQFKSEWYTCLDDFQEGELQGWVLSSDSKFKDTDLSLFRGNPDHERKVFTILLSSLFGKPYTVESAAELATLAEMGRYYTALPSISISLFAAAHRNPDFFLFIKKDPCSVLASAKILRNELLYHESLLLTLGPWHSPVYLTIEDSEVRRCAAEAYAILCTKLDKAHRQLLLVLVYHKTEFNRSPPYSDLGEEMARLAGSCILKVPDTSSSRGEFTSELRLPEYYRKLIGLPLKPISTTQGIRNCVGPVLTNELKLIPNAVSGEGNFKDYFFCLKPGDVVLPWDKTEDEWYT